MSAARDEEPLAWCPGCGDRIRTRVVRERGVCSECWGTRDDPWAAGRAETGWIEWAQNLTGAYVTTTEEARQQIEALVSGLTKLADLMSRAAARAETPTKTPPAEAGATADDAVEDAPGEQGGSSVPPCSPGGRAETITGAIARVKGGASL